LIFDEPTLAEALAHAGQFDLVVMGDMQNHAGVAATLGASLNLPVLIGVDDVALEPGNAGRVIAHRRTPTALETLSATTPALAAISAVHTGMDVPGFKQQLAAKKLPVNTYGSTRMADGRQCARSYLGHEHLGGNAKVAPTVI
jgi:electron transfer flavoprotein alpha/beta subunit